MLIHIVSFLTGRKIVFLEDSYGEVYKTLEYKTPFGNKAYVYWLTKVGHVNLEPDGTTTGQSTYINRWIYLK